MSYEVETEPEADEDISKLPPLIQDGVIRQLLVLAASPYAGGTRPTQPPYPGGQLYRAEFEAAAVTRLLDAVFRYSQDETRLHIVRVFVEYM